MALDGITTAAIVTELKEKLIGGRSTRYISLLPTKSAFPCAPSAPIIKCWLLPIPVIPGCTSPKTPEKTP